MPDPDFDDTGSLASIEFGDAISFISGQFPNYKLTPRNNDTDPGIYSVKLVLTDDNPVPQTSSYTFKIIVEALPPSVINVLASSANATNVRRPIPGAPKLQTRLSRITNAAVAFVIFSQPMR